MNKYSLLNFFYTLMQAAFLFGPNAYGNPVSYLMERLVLSQDQFIDKLLSSTPVDSHEMRLNGAGLKLYWKHREGKAYIRIGGDQAKLYPEFVKVVEEIIHTHGYDRKLY